MKKIVKVLMVCLVFSFVLVGCGKKTNTDTPDINVKEAIEKLEEGFGEEDLPMLVTNEITSENVKSYLGVDNLKIVEGYVREPMIGSIPLNVVMVKLDAGEDVEKAKKAIQDNVDPRKWVCTEAEKVSVVNRGNIILLIMGEEAQVSKFEMNFMNL